MIMKNMAKVWKAFKESGYEVSTLQNFNDGTSAFLVKKSDKSYLIKDRTYNGPEKHIFIHVDREDVYNLELICEFDENLEKVRHRIIQDFDVYNVMEICHIIETAKNMQEKMSLRGTARLIGGHKYGKDFIHQQAFI
jgi:hypothetical protein